MKDLKIILENAIREEEYFEKLYHNIADKTSDERLKGVLLGLSSQERIHKEKLLTLKFDDLESTTYDLDFDDLPDLDTQSSFEDIKEIFRFAIKQEAIAKHTYETLAKSLKDVSVQKLLLFLAEEEAKHEQILLRELDRL